MSASQISLIIGGESRSADLAFERKNPVTGTVATRAAAASIEDAIAAVDAAKTDETRQRRIAKTVEDLQQGKA